MAYEDLTTPALEDFTSDQLRDLTESSATSRIFRLLVSHHVIGMAVYYDIEAGEDKIEKRVGFERIFEQNGRLHQVNALAWLNGSEESTELRNLCDGGEAPEFYADIPVRMIGQVTTAKAHGMYYPHQREYGLFQISDEYSELDGSTLITYQKKSLQRDGEYHPHGQLRMLKAREAADLTQTLINAHFDGEGPLTL